MDLDRAKKPLRQMRKSLKQLPEDPPPEAVHKLRTRARHIESIAAALAKPGKKKTRLLLKSIKPVRKAAGDVRDMDVLTSNALTLPQNAHPDSLVRLIEHLGVVRQKSVSNLLDAVDHQRKTARHILKQYAKVVESTLASKNSRERDKVSAKASQHVQAIAADLMDELRRWPALNARNIHPFRLKIRKLRPILQLLPDANANLVSALGSVKDQIGDWHDWQQLAQTAAEVLDSSEDLALLTQIRRIGKQKLRQALAAANALRKRYLKPTAPRRSASN